MIFFVLREVGNVVVSPSGSLLRLKSPILEFSFLDASLSLEERKVPLENLRSTVRNKTSVDQDQDTNSSPQGDQIIFIVSSEKGASAYSLPSQRLIHTYSTPVRYLLDKNILGYLSFFLNDGLSNYFRMFTPLDDHK